MTAGRPDPDYLRDRDPVMTAFNPALAVYLRRALVAVVESYQQRGRKFAELDGATLRQEFLRVFDIWAAAAPDSALALNDAAAEFLLRRKPAPIEEIADRLGLLVAGGGSRREPFVVIAIGRLLFAPFMGALLVADDEPDEAALSRDFDAVLAAVRPRRVR